MKHIALLALLVFASSASAQSVTLPVQVRAETGAWVHIKPVKVDGGVPKWRLDPELEEIPPETFLPPEAAKVFVGKMVKGPPGKWKVESWNAKGDVASEIAVCWVVIGSPGPRPPPVDPPKKVATHITFVGAEKTALSLATNNDAALRAWLKDNGVKVHVYSANDPRLTELGLAKAVEKANGAPCVITQDEVGNVLGQETMTTVERVKGLVKP